MQWKFWKKDDDNTKPSDDTSNSEDNKTDKGVKNTSAPENLEGVASHKVLNEKIETIIAEIYDYIRPRVEEIQVNRGNTRHITEWAQNPDNIVTTVLQYADAGTRPSKKDLLYGNIFGDALNIDANEAIEYEQRIKAHLEEKRPSDGFFKNMTMFKGEDAQSIVEKKKFISEFQPFTLAVKDDISTELEQSQDELADAKNAAIDKIKSLSDFYEMMMKAIEERDLDAMLDISHDRTEAVVSRVLNIDWSDVAEQREIEAIVKHVGVFDEIIDMAATAQTPDEGIAILDKVLKDVTNTDKKLGFVETVIQQMEMTEGSSVYQAYLQYMIDFAGEYLELEADHFTAKDKILNVSLQDNNTLTIRHKGALQGVQEKTLSFDEPHVASAFYRIISAQDHMMSINAESTSVLNTNFISYVAQSPNDDQEMVLMLAADDRAWSKLSLEDTTSSQQQDIFAKAKADQRLTAITDDISINTDDIIAIKYDASNNELFWAIPYTANVPTWQKCSVTEEDANAFLEQLKQTSSFMELGDGYLYNLDRIQAVQFTQMTQEQLRDIEPVSADEYKRQHFGEDSPIIIDQYSLKDVLEEMDLDSALEAVLQTDSIDIDSLTTNIESNKYFEKVDINDAEQQRASDGLETEETQQQEEETVTFLRIVTETGINGYTEWYNLDISEKDAVKLIEAISQHKSYVRLSDNYTANTNQLDLAVARPFDFPEYDEFGYMTEDHDNTQPSLTLYFNGVAHNNVSPAQVSDNVMRTALEKLTENADAYTHENNKDGDDYTGLAVFKRHLIGVDFEPAQDENASEDQAPQISAKYNFKSRQSDDAGFSITISAERLEQEYQDATSEQSVSIRDQDGTIISFFNKSYLRSFKQRGHASEFILENGVSANAVKSFNSMSEEQGAELRQALKATGSSPRL